MDPALKRRLDTLVVLNAFVIGLAVATLFTGNLAGPFFLVVALLPAFVVVMFAYVYIDRGVETGADDGVAE